MHQKEYPIIRFLADLHFHDVAMQLNELVKFFNSNIIGPFMYNGELDFFIASFRRANSMQWSYLRYTVNDMYKKYYRQDRTRPDPPVDDVDGEWVDVKDDHDDEITFRANANPDEVVPNDQLDDTLLYVPSPRQQDECQEQQNEEGDNLINEKFVYDEYQTFDPSDQFDDTFYMVNDYWNDDTDAGPLHDDDTIRQVDDELDEQELKYVTHIQDGYTVEQSIQEGYKSVIEVVPNLRAQEVFTAYSDLNLTHATENHTNWAPTPVKVVGPEPEPCELLFHEQAQADLNDPHYSVKKEPPSFTSTPRKKAHFALGDETGPVQTLKVQSRLTAKLMNMFAEDLPNSEEKPSTMPQGQSPTVNTYNMHFTVLGAAGDYDLFTPNRRQPNNNNNNNANGGDQVGEELHEEWPP